MEVNDMVTDDFDETTCNSVESEMGHWSDSSSDIAASEDDLDLLREFCFETPRLAYKANNDYKELVQAMVLWKSQLAQAKRDKQELLKCKERALADPFKFVEDLKEKKLQLPRPQKIAPVPNMDFKKYNAPDLKSCTRSRYSIIDQTEEAENVTETRCNQWSEEEQRQLEALLLVYPPEEVDARRWEKIAVALGTRTPRQVASRVQKLFAKLATSDGRVTSLHYQNKHKRRKTQDIKYRCVEPQKIGYDEVEVSDEDDIPTELRNTPEYQELILVKKVLKKKMEQNGNILEPKEKLPRN